jgi:hypothetical protein
MLGRFETVRSDTPKEVRSFATARLDSRGVANLVETNRAVKQSLTGFRILGGFRRCRQAPWEPIIVDSGCR